MAYAYLRKGIHRDECTTPTANGLPISVQGDCQWPSAIPDFDSARLHDDCREYIGQMGFWTILEHCSPVDATSPLLTSRKHPE